ncbi:hypothetical protein [Caballeronia sp. LZ001]|uniref:hypothetical protein n=1 Tax=Caballeronia sp. LZ001 TaxID=3038553 RepID=UPI002866A37D|nr:hypothetical protein [Caballeronia sp. LZ001]MDR5802860.1 hypothetical protein [Caballeronia sp. LZ001]
MNRPEYSLTLDSVICRRCNAVSRAEEETCPSCGSDRQGAIFTTRSDPVAPIASAAPAAAAAAPMPGQLDITDLRDTGWLTRLVRRRMVTSYPSLAEPGDLPPEAERKPARKGLAVLIGGVVAGLAAGGYLYVQSDVGVVTANRPVISAAGSIGNGASAARGAGDEKRAGLDQSRAVAEQARTLASADDDAKRVRADDAQRLASRANSADAGSRRAPDASSAGGSVAITGVTAGASATPSGNRPMATAMADRRATNAGLGNSTVAKPAMGTEPKSAALALASTGQAPQSATTPVVKTASIADAGVSTGAVVSQSKPSAGGGTVSAQTPAASALGASQNKALASNAAGACDAGASTVKPASPGNATMASGSSNKAPANDAIGTREAVAAGTDGKKNVNAAQPAAPSLAAHSAPGAVASPATQTAANSKPENGSTSSKPATQTVAGGATSADASRGNAAASNGIASTTAKPVMQTAAASANTPDTSRSNATTLATSETTASGKPATQTAAGAVTAADTSRSSATTLAASKTASPSAKPAAQTAVANAPEASQHSPAAGNAVHPAPTPLASTQTAATVIAQDASRNHATTSAASASPAPSPKTASIAAKPADTHPPQESPAVARNIAAVQQALANRDLAAARRNLRVLASSQSRNPEVQQLAADVTRQERARDSAVASARSCPLNKDPSCAVRNARRAVALDPRNAQTQAVLRHATAAQYEANIAYFSQGAAIPAPAVPAMTFDGRWSVGSHHAPVTSLAEDRSNATLFGWGVPTVAKGRGDAH